jgi:hypothetical protein
MAQWLVMNKGQTSEPLTGEEVHKRGIQGFLVPGMSVREEPGGQWMPVEKSPFASVVKRQPRVLLAIAIGVLTFLFVAISCGMLGSGR